MKFKGDVVITDPCYLDGNNEKLDSSTWWEDSSYGEDGEYLGFTSYIYESTIIGDWSWITYDSDTGDLLGKFCADAGLVCVCLLDEVLKFNPDFKYWALAHPWCVTIIKDFDGYIEYEVDENDEFHIVGKGNINFRTE